MAMMTLTSGYASALAKKKSQALSSQADGVRNYIFTANDIVFQYPLEILIPELAVEGADA